jgi:hypothetical protein
MPARNATVVRGSREPVPAFTGSLAVPAHASFLAAWLAASAMISAFGCLASAADKDEKLFDTLTRHEWGVTQPGQFGFTETLTLRRDGTYLWWRHSDYQERNDKGTWSVVADQEDAGLLRLSASGETRVRIDGDKLRLTQRTLPRSKLITYTDKEKMLRAGDVKPLPPSEAFLRLTSTVWVATSPFDNYRLPERVEFLKSGRYVASYRGGTCRHEGSWGLFTERGKILFDNDPDKNDCDKRGGTAGFSNYELTFADEIALLGGAPYAPEAKRPKGTVFFFDRYGNTVRTRGEFPGELRKGKSVRIDFRHESASGSSFILHSIEVGLQKHRTVKGGGVADGEPQWLVKHDLSKVAVTKDKPLHHSLDVTPPFAGEVMLLIRLKYEDIYQKYEGYQIYFTTVLEK